MTHRAEDASPSTDENRPLRDFIHEQMRRRGWNYSEFARAVGTNGSVVSRWIRDRTPTPKMTRQMAERLGVDTNELMRIAGHLEPVRSEPSVEHAALIEKVRQIELTPDRYFILDALLEDLRHRKPNS